MAKIMGRAATASNVGKGGMMQQNGMMPDGEPEGAPTFFDEAVEEEKAEGNKKSKRRRKGNKDPDKDPDAPKRPRTAFSFFMDEYRATFTVQWAALLLARACAFHCASISRLLRRETMTMMMISLQTLNARA